MKKAKKVAAKKKILKKLTAKKLARKLKITLGISKLKIRGLVRHEDYKPPPPPKKRGR
jgi:hypothetical protein